MDQTDVMARSLLIAALVVLPYAIFKLRQVRATRASHEAALAREAHAGGGSPAQAPRLPALEDVIADIGFVVSEAQQNGGAILVVPHDVTVSDRPGDPRIIDALVRDALRRSNLVVTAEMDSSEGRVLECALMSTAS